MINLFAVLVSGIVAMILGAAWYGTFKNPWMRAIGLDPERIDEFKKKQFSVYLANFFGALILAYVIAQLLAMTGTAVVGSALGLAFLLWLGFATTLSLGPVLWEGRPWSLYLINVGYYLVEFLAIVLILIYWH